MYDLTFVKDYPVKVELHAHTYPASGCGHVSPENTVDTYAKDGADAIVITNHFYPGMLGRDCWKNFSPAEIIECYLDDYYKAQKRGKEIGVSVIFGVELRFEENINDYLRLPELSSIFTGFIRNTVAETARDAILSVFFKKDNLLDQSIYIGERRKIIAEELCESARAKI